MREFGWFRAAVLLGLGGLPLWPAGGPAPDPTAGAALAFARYAAGGGVAAPWSLETVEIEASLPKQEKHGRLRAIRRLWLGKPEFEVLETSGDRTVRQQIIARYLSAEVRAADLAPSSVAITVANYKFKYKGPASLNGTGAYAFLITPRQKREGLIKGELWLDAETGLAVRQAGYLVKGPSILVKRVDVVRETTLRNGRAAARITHLSADTRLLGPAELTVAERPGAGDTEER